MQPNKHWDNIMKLENLTRDMLSAGFAFGLFASQQNFVLTAPDNTVVGQGAIEEVSNSIAQVKITFQGQEFIGSGIVSENTGSSEPIKQRQGVRGDRALLESFSMKHKKHAKTFLVSKDGAKLACELKVSGSEIGGQCINPDNQQVLTIKTPTGEHS